MGEEVGKPRVREKAPLLPLRDMVVFPFMVVPLFVGRKQSIKALEHAMVADRLIVLAAQKRPNTDNPRSTDIYQFGTISEILQLLKLPDGTIKLLVEGITRVRIKEYIEKKEFFLVRIEEIEERYEFSHTLQALIRSAVNRFEEYVKLNKNFPHETMLGIVNIEEPGRLADIITAHLDLKVKEKQAILETISPEKRLEKVLYMLNSEIEILGIEQKIQGRVRKQMNRAQKEYYLTERLRAIQKELGKKDERKTEIEELSHKIKRVGMSKEAQERAMRELERLEKMPPMSQEGAVIRNYLDWMVSLPWKRTTKDKLDIERAEKILEEDHYGLEKVKERVLEYLAVRKLVKKMKGPILCFVGPPGVGKTSVAKSIAKAMGRRFVRLSLGGVRDEAEIRGHRMTYVAALPGRMIQSLRKAKSRNPVFLLDEVDKMSMDFRGDPSSALLEVLDPEQNHTFSDHYLEVPFDLSDVMFITTANVLYSIPLTLRDRMEILEFPSYTEREKERIASLFLVPKQIKAHGLTKRHISFTKEALLSIIRRYTKEAGVRNLEREIGQISRKVAREVAKGEKKKVNITPKNLHKFLGPPRYRIEIPEKEERIGVVTGLAWTEVGGDILNIEAMIMPGKGELILTGKLGEVMKESGRAALSYARSKAKALNIDPNFYKKTDVHIHVPEGAIPKDGPSAGICMATALVSTLTSNPVNRGLAMTGELTLRGRVLSIGGVKEKILAAHRAGIKTVLIPKDNEKDISEIPKYVLRKIKIDLVEDMEEVLNKALINNANIHS